MNKNGKEKQERINTLHRIITQVVKTYSSEKFINHIEGVDLPSRNFVIDILRQILDLLFPGFKGEGMTKDSMRYRVGDYIHEIDEHLAGEILKSLKYRATKKAKICVVPDNLQKCAEDLALKFMGKLPVIRKRLREDVSAAYWGDPAAKSDEEIVLSYPGLIAVATYRIAHELCLLGVDLIPRMMTEWAHSQTGIDIHPGANIGKYFFIDHGTGVVIGETTLIGDNVKLYQGVTLGALSFPKDEKGRLIRGAKRHPTIRDNVTIYAGATILGGETVIGKNAVIGGNVWLTKSVPAGAKVVLGAQHEHAKIIS